MAGKKDARRDKSPAERSSRGRPPLVAARPSRAKAGARVAGPEVPLDRVDALVMGVLAVIAWSLYLVNLSVPPIYMYDEAYHAFTVGEMVRGNHDAYRWDQKVPTGSPGAAYDWTHPPLSKLIMQVSVRAFGDGPIGWRLASVIFGGLGVALLYLLGRVMLGRFVGLVAATLLLLDGLWFVQSRICMNDIFVACFLIAAYLAFYLYVMRMDRRYLWGAGLLLGLALGTKWSAIFSIGYLGLVALVVEYRQARRSGQGAAIVKQATIVALALLVLPAAVYVAVYSQFFAWGHSFATFLELQQRMMSLHAYLRRGHPAASRWWTWPLILQPVRYASGRMDDGRLMVINAMGNPATFWCYVPAVAAAAYWWWKNDPRRVALGLIVIGFVGQWVSWAISGRVSFIYHFLPSVPFGCLALALTLYELRRYRYLVAGYLLLVLMSFAFFYPILSAQPLTRQAIDRRYWMDSWEYKEGG